MKKFFRENGLSLILALITLLTLLAHLLTGWQDLNNERQDFGQTHLRWVSTSAVAIA
nr:DUF6766 family protein [Siphonobacter sp. BAB-5405]